MGEFAIDKISGERFKIGTCEDLMYLRYAQRHLVGPGEECAQFPLETNGYRFRFPFPDEDHVPPGHFRPAERGVVVPNFTVSAEWLRDEQVDCSPSDCGDEPVQVVYQRPLDGTLWTVVRIKPRTGRSWEGALFRLSYELAAEAAACFLNEAGSLLEIADGRSPDDERVCQRIAHFDIRMGRRILAGYASLSAANA